MRTKRMLLILAIVSTLIMILYAQFVFGYNSKCFKLDEGPNSIGLSFGYTVKEVNAFLSSRNVAQLQCYRLFILVWDMVFPILYGIMHVLWLLVIFNKRWWVFILPIIHVLLDWLENTLEITMVNNYLTSKPISESLVSLGSITTISKWSASMITYVLILTGVAILIFKRIKNEK